MSQIKDIVNTASSLNRMVEAHFIGLKNAADQLNIDLNELQAVDTDVISALQKQKLKEASEYLQKARTAMNVATERYTVNPSRPLLVAVS